MNEVMSTWKTEAWLSNTRVSTLRSIISMLLESWRDIIINSGLAAIIRISSIAGVVILMFKNIIVFIEGYIEKFGFAIGFITILAELLAVLLFMPEGFN